MLTPFVVLSAAEYMLDAIGSGSGKRIGPRDWAEVSSLPSSIAIQFDANDHLLRGFFW